MLEQDEGPLTDANGDELCRGFESPDDDEYVDPDAEPSGLGRVPVMGITPARDTLRA